MGTAIGISLEMREVSSRNDAPISYTLGGLLASLSDRAIGWLRQLLLK